MSLDCKEENPAPSNDIKANYDSRGSTNLLPKLAAAHVSKKQLKRQRKLEIWLQHKAEKRVAEKEKKKRRLAELRERGEDIGPNRKSLKKNTMKDSSCNLRVVIDCSFDSYMSDKDTSFLVQQIQHCYAANRRAHNPLQLYVCSIGGKAKQRLDNIGDYKGWDIHKEERPFLDLFSKNDVIYLTSESPNVLQVLDHNKVYIIGGLVDHNHHKGLCYDLAQEKDLGHAQLPISQFLQLKSRKVLTINHVFEILLRFTETHDWQKSFLSVLPQRKGVSVKDCSSDIKNTGQLSKQVENTQEDSLQTRHIPSDSQHKDHTQTDPTHTEHSDIDHTLTDPTHIEHSDIDHTQTDHTVIEHTQS